MPASTSLWNEHRPARSSVEAVGGLMSKMPDENPILPMLKSWWMWQDRYLITEIRTYNDVRQVVSIYEDGALLTDGSLYGNDY